MDTESYGLLGSGELDQRPADYALPEHYDPVRDFGGLVKYPGSPTLLMAGQDLSVEEGERLIREGVVDMVTFARAFICNPVSSR